MIVAQDAIYVIFVIIALNVKFVAIVKIAIIVSIVKTVIDAKIYRVLNIVWKISR